MAKVKSSVVFSTLQVLTIVVFITSCVVVTPPSTPSMTENSYTFQTLYGPEGLDVVPNEINASGEIVGVYLGDDNRVHSFLLTAGEFTTIDFPGATDTFAGGINDAGNIVGDYYDAGGNQHGFLVHEGEFTTIDFPGATGTSISKINNLGQIVGAYFTADTAHNFVLNEGKFSVVDFARIADFSSIDRSFVTGINDSGEMVGISEVARGIDRESPPLLELSFNTTEPVAVAIPGIEGEFVGDHFAILAEDAKVYPRAQTRIEMLAANTGPLYITSESTDPQPESIGKECFVPSECIFDGFPNNAIGNASLSLKTMDNKRVLVVENIGASLGDGVAQLVPETMVMVTELLAPNFSRSSEGATLLTTQTGIVGNKHDQLFSQLTIVNTGERLQVVGDWSPIGTTKYEIRIFKGSELVTSHRGLRSGELVLLGTPDIEVMRCHIWIIIVKHPHAIGKEGPIRLALPSLATTRIPETANILALDINNSGATIGQYYESDPDRPRGFLLQNGRLSLLDFPNARVTGPVGINDAGQIVGFYDDDGGQRHGFIAYPTP